MRYNFDEIIDRTGTQASKWAAVERLFGSADVLPLWVADMDFRIAQPIVDAVIRRAEHPIYGYTMTASALDSVVERLYRKYGWEIKPEWVIITPGVMPGVNAAVRAFAGPNRAVVVQSPAYPPFWGAMSNNNCTPAVNMLRKSGNRYEVDFEDLDRQFEETGAKAMILCSPHNPVGRVWTREELVRMGETALRHDAIVIADEIHCEVVLGDSVHVPFASISPEFRDSCVTSYSPSKTFNVAGTHCSVAIIPNQRLRDEFNAVRAGLMGSPDLFAVSAMEAAFRHGDEWLRQLLKYLEGNLEYLLKFFEQRVPEIKPNRPEGTYLAWLDCRGLGLEPEALRSFFNQKAKVGLNDGVTFGPGGQGFARLNFACPRKTLEEGLRRIESAVKGL